MGKSRLPGTELEIDALEGVAKVAVAECDVPDETVADRTDHEAEAARVDALEQHVLRGDGHGEAVAAIPRALDPVFHSDCVILCPNITVN